MANLLETISVFVLDVNIMYLCVYEFISINLFSLIVAKKPMGSAPIFIEPLQPVEVVEGSAAKLQCRLTGSPEPNIQWFKDSELVKEDKRTKMRFDGELCTLKILATELDDDGVYKCVAKNDFGSVASDSELLVNEANKKPEFVEKMKPMNVSEGEAARFDVQVEGYPAPVVEWFKGKDKLEDEGRYVMVDDGKEGRFTLIVENAGPEDAGSYKCVASNEEGHASSKAALAVKEEMLMPEFLDEEESGPIDVTDGDELCLTIGVKGKPVPSVAWYKDDRKLRKTSRIQIDAKGDKFSLVVLDIKPEDSGIYRCEASSKAGTATRTFNVNVTGMFIVFHFKIMHACVRSVKRLSALQVCFFPCSFVRISYPPFFVMILFRYGLPPKINVALFFLSPHIFREKKTKTKSVTNPSVRLVKIDFKALWSAHTLMSLASGSTDYTNKKAH